MSDARAALQIVVAGHILPERLLRGRGRVRVSFRQAERSATGSVFEVQLARPGLAR